MTRLVEGERERLLHMESALASRVIGQDEAIRAVSDTVRRSRAGLSDVDRPNGSFLFLGPTGVGKTELCKALAEFLFDTEEALVRVDMSEFMESHSIARLIGAPPGYVGYEEGGHLTETVRRRPYAVVLLDEIEKAHHSVFNLLLQVLDDGRLTDGHGRTVDFRNTVVVMTSNLGTEIIQGAEGPAEEIRAGVLEIVRGHFRPEFVNRIDEMVVFRPLGRDEVRAIVDLEVGRLRARLAERGIGLSVTDAALDRIADSGYDPAYGARPLKRAFRVEVENPLARRILAGEIGDRETVRIDRDGESLTAAPRRSPPTRARFTPDDRRSLADCLPDSSLARVTLRILEPRQPPLPPRSVRCRKPARICVVGVTGFEPTTPTSRTWCSTRLSYTPSGSVRAFDDELGERREGLPEPGVGNVPEGSRAHCT